MDYREAARVKDRSGKPAVPGAGGLGAESLTATVRKPARPLSVFEKPV